MKPHKITVDMMRVDRDPESKKYIVEIRYTDGSWLSVGKSYDHLTSAYAALGRIIHEASRYELLKTEIPF